MNTATFRPLRRRAAIVMTLLSTALPIPAARATEPERSPPRPQAIEKTAKERLSDKATDEQRVDDCKVAPGRRTRARPAACPWDVGS